MEKSQWNWKRGNGGFLLSGMARLGKELPGMEGKREGTESFVQWGAKITSINYPGRCSVTVRIQIKIKRRSSRSLHALARAS